MHIHPHTSAIAIIILAAQLPTGIATGASPKVKAWQFIGETASGITQYIDMDTLRKEHGYVRVRTLVDYKKPVWSVTSKKIFSEIDEQYIDCANRRSALLAAASFECGMARCRPKEDNKYDIKDLHFRSLARVESLDSNLFDLVCQK